MYRSEHVILDTLALIAQLDLHISGTSKNQIVGFIKYVNDDSAKWFKLWNRREIIIILNNYLLNLGVIPHS